MVEINENAAIKYSVADKLLEKSFIIIKLTGN
jgi:hypothetical protein